MPENVERVIAQAERICRHEFDLLGHERLRYGAEIDWHLDAVSGKRAPLQSWFKIQYLNYEKVGDAKVTWELNRHQHLVTLSKAWLFTGDERFVRELISQWYSWRQQNPYPTGINWASSLEVAFRAISWLWVIHLLANCPSVSSAFKSDVYEALMLSGRHLERYRSTYFSPNTHLLGEGVALFFLGTLCNGKASARWQRLGFEIVLAQAERQVLADGMHFEQSTYYHVYALDMFLHATILARANGISIPEKLDRTIEKMLEALCSLSCGGVVPRFGDDDGGRFFDPRRNRVEHLLDPLSTGAALLGRTDLKAAQPELVEETVWLLGTKSARKFDDIPLAATPVKSTALSASGLYIMAIATGTGSRLVMDAGPHGVYGGGHGHADALSIQVAVAGMEVLVDPGTFAYTSVGLDRHQFRSTGFHNTIQLDEVDQAEADGPFPWRRLPLVSAEACASGNSFDFLLASHTGYEALPNAVTHRRLVFSDKSQFWFLLDVLEGRGPHHAKSFWHVAPNLRWQLQTGCAQAVGEAGGVALVFADRHSWVPRIVGGRYSPVYGTKINSEALTFECNAVFPEHFATLVVPLANAVEGLSLGIMREEATEKGLLAYRYDRPAESHFFFFSGRTPWKWRQLSSDARFLHCAISPCGCKRLVICDGSYVRIEGNTAVSCSRIVSHLEWWNEDGRDFFSCSHEEAFSSSSWEQLYALQPGTAEVAQ